MCGGARVGRGRRRSRGGFGLRGRCSGFSRRLRLDPNSKSDNDRLFAILSQDEIRQLDMEGKPIDSTLPYNLKRSAQ